MDLGLRTYYSGHDSMLCVILALEMILNILCISFFYHIYVSMYLFYVVDGLDIKKIEKNEYFGTKRFFPDYFLLFPNNYDFFRFFPHADIIPITINATLFLSITR